MKYWSPGSFLVLSILAAGTWLACSKIEPASPSAPPERTTGVTKSALNTFIGLTISGPITFQVCNTSCQLQTVADGVYYHCPDNCRGNQVCIGNGSGAGTCCFDEGQWYHIKATTGPPTRQTLHIMFPAGYGECTLALPTKFHYNPGSGMWAPVGGILNGVQWSQSLTTGDC